MMNTDFFQLIYTYLEERTFHNVYEQLKEDAEYQEAVRAEHTFFEQYEELGLSEKQYKIIEQWTDAIQKKCCLLHGYFSNGNAMLLFFDGTTS